MTHTLSTEIGGTSISFEMGRLAKQANGAVLVRSGGTAVLVTACFDPEPKEHLDFLPLTVDYREYTYAAGKYPGGFHKREGRPSEKEVLTCRLIDRPIRPLFPDGYRNETQIIAMVLSVDGTHEPDMLAICGASTALFNSDSPFNSPLAAVRIGLVDDQLVVNPTIPQMETSRLNLIVAGTDEAICMVESAANEVSEELILEALALAHQNIRQLIGVQLDLFQRTQPVKVAVTPITHPADLVEEIRAQVAGPIRDALHTPGKKASERTMKQAKKTLLATLPEDDLERRRTAARIFEHLKEEIFRHDLLVDRRRPDGRAFDEIRAIDIEIDVLTRPHGSAVFTRGETQALATVTLGTLDDGQIMDTLDGESRKWFMLHYNFPPFSVGEVSFMRGPGRREIGHGMLAERALRAVLPPRETFPYTIRVVSDILESNGSSSQASVCGGSLALMAAGVPIRRAVAGVAMGLVKEDDRYAILTDIAGFEDHYGDMDFKVAGTVHGITALQMDIKVKGLTMEILKEALDQAHRGRMYILERMNAVLPAARPELPANAPRMEVITIPEARIRDLIGPGGKTIRSITEETKSKIDIENDGTVHIFADNQDKVAHALRLINAICQEAEIDQVYQGKVTRLEPYGAFVEILPGTEGLLHISEVSHRRIPDIRDELNVGDEIAVKVVALEPPNRIRLSMKALQEPPADGEERGGPPREHRGDRGDRRPPDRDRGNRGGGRPRH